MQRAPKPSALMRSTLSSERSRVSPAPPKVGPPARRPPGRFALGQASVSSNPLGKNRDQAAVRACLFGLSPSCSLVRDREEPAVCQARDMPFGTTCDRHDVRHETAGSADGKPTALDATTT